MMIETINDVLYTAGVATVQSLWLPLAVWTVLAVPIYAGLRAWKRLHLVVGYYLQQALLLSLPLSLAAANLFDVSGWIASSGGAEVSGGGSVVVMLPAVVDNVAGTAAPARGLYHLLGLLTAAAVLVALWQFLRLIRHAVGLAWFARVVGGRLDIELQDRTERIAEELNIRRPVRAVTTSRDISPMTFGYRRPTVVIPNHIAEDRAALEMTLVHELTHVRRGDYVWHWVERLVEACAAIHPLVYRLRREISALREMICDAEVIDTLSCSRKRYALLLYETIVSEHSRDTFAMAMSESGINIKRRIEAMKEYTNTAGRFLTPKRMGLTLGGLLMAGAVVLVSCSDIVSPNDPATDVESTAETSTDQVTEPSADDGPEVFVAVEQMPKLIGGIERVRQQVSYPEQARQAGVEGIVVVQFIVDERGNVVEPQVLRGIGVGCDIEALRVVRQMEFEPGRQRGKPVRVKMSLPIRFALTDNEGSSTSTDGSQTSSTIQLEIGSDGTILLDDRPVELDKLGNKIQSIVRKQSARVTVRIDGGTSIGFVNDVQKQLRSSGVRRISYRSRG